MGITGFNKLINPDSVLTCKKAFALWKTLMVHRKYSDNTYEVGTVKIIPNTVMSVGKPLPIVTDGRRQIWGQDWGGYTFGACHLLTRALCTFCGGPIPKYPKEKGPGCPVRWKVLLTLAPTVFCCLGFRVLWETEFWSLGYLVLPFRGLSMFPSQGFCDTWVNHHSLCQGQV